VPSTPFSCSSHRPENPCISARPARLHPAGHDTPDLAYAPAQLEAARQKQPVSGGVAEPDLIQQEPDAARAEYEEVDFPIEEIVRDDSLRPRLQRDPETVDSYAADMKAGADFPPITLVRASDGKHYLAGGDHRIEAARKNKQTRIKAIIHEGTVDDACWMAAGSNKTHGLRRSNGDKQKAVRMAILAKPDAGTDEIARHVGVSKSWVEKTRREMTANGELTKADNTELSRRRKTASGGKRRTHNLTVDQQTAILAALDAGERGKDLAQEYGVTPETISRLKAKAKKESEKRAVPETVDDPQAQLEAARAEKDSAVEALEKQPTYNDDAAPDAKDGEDHAMDATSGPTRPCISLAPAEADSTVDEAEAAARAEWIRGIKASDKEQTTEQTFQDLRVLLECADDILREAARLIKKLPADIVDRQQYNKRVRDIYRAADYLASRLTLEGECFQAADASRPKCSEPSPPAPPVQNGEDVCDPPTSGG